MHDDHRARSGRGATARGLAIAAAALSWWTLPLRAADAPSASSCAFPDTLTAAAARVPSRLLQHIALQSDPNGAALALSFSSTVSPQVLRLHDPERLVVDLLATERRAKLPVLNAGGAVTALRSGVHEGGTLRLVLELQRPLRPTCTLTTDGDSYILRIALGASASSEAPSASAPGAVPVEATVSSAVALPTGAAASTSGGTTPGAAATATLDESASAGLHTEHAARNESPARAEHAARREAEARNERDLIVAVDAGHGGDDPGASGQGGTHEKDVTLAIARALAQRIDRQPGLHAVLTRDGDYFVKLTDRIARARAAHADMFVSIHADAVRERDVSGASVYILSERGASSEEARELAEQQNAVDLKAGVSAPEPNPDVRSVLIDLRQQAGIGQSVEAADRVLNALDHVGAVRKREVQQAAFVVLKSPMVSMLIETAYISNPAEERKLRSAPEQQRLAEAIFSGIDSYFRKFPPDGSHYARGHRAPVESDVALARSNF